MRIVVDEAHSSFLSKSYRPKMEVLARLREAPVPKILLTATLAPDHGEVLASSFGITLSQALVLRSPTARPNHRLWVVALSPTHTPSAVGLRLASLLLEKWDSHKTIRGIMFVRSLKKLGDVSASAEFPVCTYHGHMSDQEKESQLCSWLSDEGPARWMIATTALLHGIDYPRVDAVIFLESPFGLYDFVQGAGRAGRSGQDSLIVVLHIGPPPVLPDENPYVSREEMGHVLTTTACRRMSISKFMDGHGLSCFQLPGSFLCDLCEGHIDPLIKEAINAPLSAPVQTNAAVRDFVPRPPPRAPPSALLTGFAAQANVKARKQHGDSAKENMERFAGCFVCRIKSDDHDPCHSKCGSSGASGCTVDRHRAYDCTCYDYKMGWMEWKKGFRWPRDVSRCYFCGFSSATVPYSHKESGRYPGICRFSDTAVVAAWHVLHSPDLFKKLQKELGFVPGVDLKATFATWLTQYGSDSEEIRLLSVFSWLCRQYYPDSA